VEDEEELQGNIEESKSGTLDDKEEESISHQKRGATTTLQNITLRDKHEDEEKDDKDTDEGSKNDIASKFVSDSGNVTRMKPTSPAKKVWIKPKLVERTLSRDHAPFSPSKRNVLSSPSTKEFDDFGGGTRLEDNENENEDDQSLPTNLSPELLSLFEIIDKYDPREIELETELKCFIPQYIPAIGEIDPFLKVPRPDGVPDGLGLYVVDEPALVQSDPAILELQLKAKMKKRRNTTIVRSIENAANNPYEIENWIQSVEDLHRSKPPPEVLYKFEPPDVEEILSPFPSELASALEGELSGALDPELDLSLEQYAKVICAMLDVPVRGGDSLNENNLIENLHFLFSLTVDESLRSQNDTISAL